MNNKGQTTIFFSLIMGSILLLTLSALEFGRIHLATVKIKPCVHSMRSSIMADYNYALFERYHLLFMDPTYGTGSEAVLEEKVKDYLEVSLNGEQGSPLYQFEVEEVALADKMTILSEDMKLLKQQIYDYENAVGVVDGVKKMLERFVDENVDIEDAARETQQNGKVIESVEDNKNELSDEEKQAIKEQYKDPRDTLKNMLKTGIVSFVAPDKNYSKESIEIPFAPSENYKEQKEERKSALFDDINVLNHILQDASEKEGNKNLAKGVSFSNYVTTHFSHGTKQLDDCVMQCEIEYILKGKGSDFDNIEAVIEDIIWMRMPLNYAYLLTDVEKKGQALTIATAISIATGTEPFVEVIKYLLLGCWAYGETLQEMKLLLSGECIPIVKTKTTWYTDLESLAPVNSVEKVKVGLKYEDYLSLMLASKTGISLNASYARMLDVIQLNLREKYSSFQIKDCVGTMWIQGKITLEPFFQDNADLQVYQYYFDELVSYQ